ncbi:hypothetical protein PLICRDRAFT_90755 [Plicaturopsis crispa FD-325 SS-3]|nr:hypothetical protein PLICRDRAFT_90755 [Plicaturopsis crispa FD-325 SS-3]
MYVYGSAGTCSTHSANRKEFDKWKIVPRMLVDAGVRTLETTIFGVKYPSPLLIAPIGVQGIVHADAELATARAAASVGVPMIMSTASTRAIEDVAEANGPGGKRWYQLYWPKSHDVTLSILSRAKASGFTTLVVTLDTMLLGWRPHDLETAYLPFGHGVGSQVGSSDPVFMSKFNLPPRKNERPEFPYDPKKLDGLYLSGDEKVKTSSMLGQEFLKETNSGMFRTWDDLKLLQDNWEGPIVLKGIQRVQDAIEAYRRGISGIVVSNHGGRQIDGAIPSLYALDKILQSPEIQAARKDGKFTVLFDSGIRTGSDIIKAIALGADGVLLGRPYMYGLAIAGQAGVEDVLRSTLADLEVTLGLSGYTSLEEIRGKREEIITRID